MERGTLDRSFAEKYLPIVYKTALEQLKDPALAKLAAKRVFVKVQDAMDSDSMPAETVLKAWLIFLTEDVAADMKKQMQSAFDSQQHTAHSSAANAKPASAQTSSQPTESAQKANADLPVTATARINTVPSASSSYSGTAPGDAAPSAEPDTAPCRTKLRSAERETEARISHRASPARVLLIILFVLLIVINLWFIVGLLSSREILPKLDWGYSWFDTFAFKLFDL